MENLAKLTKSELILHGLLIGIELKSSMLKADMIERIQNNQPTETKAEKGINGEY